MKYRPTQILRLASVLSLRSFGCASVVAEHVQTGEVTRALGSRPRGRAREGWQGETILGLLPTSASLAICRAHHHVDGRQQAEDVQLGSHSPPLIFGGWHQKARRRGRDWRRRLAQVDPPFSGIATNDFEQSWCRRVPLRK